MRLFGRRRETLNQRLLREAGLSTEPSAGREPAAEAERGWFEPSIEGDSGIHGHTRPRRWDAVVTVEAPELAGDEAEFATVPDGSLIVAEDEERDLGRLANAVERELRPPYRASAVRREGAVWAVSANRIEVAAVKADGEAIDLAVREGERSVAVDGIPTTRAFPELERLGEREGSDYAVHAERLDGDLWEVQVSAL